MSDNLISNTNTIFGGSQFEEAINLATDGFYPKYQPGKTGKADSCYSALEVDELVGAGTDRPLNETNNLYPLTGTLDLRLQPTLVQAPILASSAATKQYVDDQVPDPLPLNVQNQDHPLTGDLDFSGSQYAVLGKAPTQDNQLATKAYVDSGVGSEKNKIVALGDPTSVT